MSRSDDLVEIFRLIYELFTLPITWIFILMVLLMAVLIWILKRADRRRKHKRRFYDPYFWQRKSGRVGGRADDYVMLDEWLDDNNEM